MKNSYHPQSSKMKTKAKSSPSSSALDPNPVSMGISRGTPSKTKRKRNLVALRLAMLQQDVDSISNVVSPNENQLPPEPSIEPLTPIKSPNRKSKLKSSAMKPAEEVEANRPAENSSQSSAMKRAEEIQSNLPSKHPCLIRCMLHSHIDSGFWLGLPKKFCAQHLPTKDSMMELMDESGESFYAKYLAVKAALSGGWRAFAIAHNLKEGDVLVFQLAKKTTFKVYIIRSDPLGETDCAEDLDASEDVMISSEECEKITPHSDGVQQSKSVNLKGFNEFSILVDGSVSIDAKFPDETRRKYYDLCSNQNSFLHEKLLKGLNHNLVVGMIKEIVNISDAIKARNCSFEAPQSDLMVWDTTMQSFEMVGMNIGFIRKQIHKLLGSTLECEEAALEAESESEIVVGERMKTLEVKFLEMRKQMEEMNEEIEMIKASTKRNRVKLQRKNSCS